MISCDLATSWYSSRVNYMSAHMLIKKNEKWLWVVECMALIHCKETQTVLWSYKNTGTIPKVSHYYDVNAQLSNTFLQIYTYSYKHNGLITNYNSNFSWHSLYHTLNTMHTQQYSNTFSTYQCGYPTCVLIWIIYPLIYLYLKLNTEFVKIVLHSDTVFWSDNSWHS